MRNEIDGRIVPLDDLHDFEVADGDPDVRGWDVVASDGQKVGEVEHLMVDTEAMKVRYLAVERETGWFNRDDQAAVLVPIGTASLDTDGKRVLISRLAGAQIRALPGYRREHGVQRDYETSLRSHYGGTTGTGFYEGEHFDDRRFYGRGAGQETERLTLSEEELAIGKRQQKAGAVEIDKRVDTEHVSQKVPVRHEEVTVERRPVTDPMAAAGASFENDEIRVPLTREELVVEKRVVPTEELVVKKREVEENRTVEADLRREKAEIKREGDVRRVDER